MGPINYEAQQTLGYTKALDRAQELRERGGPWSWTVIAAVMEEYHGFSRGSSWWRKQLSDRVEAKPRGYAFAGRDRRVLVRR